MSISDAEIDFLSAFSSLRECCDDDVDLVLSMAIEDRNFAMLCDDVSDKYDKLIENEKAYFYGNSFETSRKTIKKSTPYEYIKSRRDFENRYFWVLKIASLARLGHDGDDRARSIAEEVMSASPNGSLASLSGRLFSTVKWKEAQEEANEVCVKIRRALGFLYDFTQLLQNFDTKAVIAEYEKSNGEDPDSEESLYAQRYSSEDYWEELESFVYMVEHCRGDLQKSDMAGVIRRKILIPTTLAPPHVSHRNEKSEKLGMLDLLGQAQAAFVFGAPFASISLLRAILEKVLREHYLCEGPDLAAMIKNSDRRIPKTVSLNDLHKLRMKANSVLHSASSSNQSTNDSSEEYLEREMVRYFLVVRNLIEGLK